MNIIKASSKDFSIKRIIKATFPDYKKHNVTIWPQKTVTLHDLNWSGGTKQEYRACTLDGKSIESKYDMGKPAPWNNQFEGLTIDIPENVAIVCHGFFCGNPSTMAIYVNPENMAKLLPEVTK